MAPALEKTQFRPMPKDAILIVMKLVQMLQKVERQEIIITFESNLITIQEGMIIKTVIMEERSRPPEKIGDLWVLKF